MRSKKDNYFLRLASLLLIILIFSGCSKQPFASKKPAEKVLATVNREPIYLRDFKRELAIRSKQDPSFKITPETLKEQIDIMVNRRLVIQEAMKKKLAEEDRFVNTIRTFWEQTLIRDFVDYKNKEFENYVYVTDAEIKDFYNKIAEEKSATLPPFDEIYPRLKAQIKEQKLKDAFEDWLQEAKEKADIKINDEALSGEK